MPESKPDYSSLITTDPLCTHAFHNAAIGLAFISHHGEWILVNASFIRMTGYSLLQLAATPLQKIFTMEDDSAGDFWSRLIRESTHFHPVIRHYSKEKYWRLEQVSTVPVTDGETVVYLVQIQEVSITEQNQLQLLHRLYPEAEKTMNSLDVFEWLFKSSYDCMDISDPQGRVLRLNRAFEATYGWKEAELIGKPLPVIPSFKTAEFDELFTKIDRGEYVVGYETQRQRKDGRIIHISLTVFPVRNQSGVVSAYACISRDITLQKRSEDHLIKTDKLNMVGHLAAGIAHEIRNPLTTMRGFFQLLESGYQGKREFYEVMLAEIDRIDYIVNEFLMIANPQTTNFQAMNVRTMLSQTILQLNSEASLRDVKIRLLPATTERGPLVYCSEIQLKQVFIHLLKNAIEAMSSGGTITVEVTREVDSVHIRIQDQGRGIPAHRIAKLGEPFYTTKERGTGLGLMSCFKILAAHEGRIDFQSELGIGTTADITLPAAQGQV
ncbi:PAS domain-containing sensor histidine kinase [Paenibacillus sp. FJAT-26967]|uniref:PAS domain-containing sensor histidine kinase n=1 Tax=Paenibacillus sp. FJAT-26967 TaxID=1729690 RepID=UPI0008386692|nr:PAS domain-containing sensor histidine kinase [Paenibacillus sp. FJAT-26967]